MQDFAISSRSRRERLKEATQGAHRRVERVVDGQGFFENCSRYGRWLLASAQFHHAAFSKLCGATVAESVGAQTLEERLTLIELDLKDLNLVPAVSREARGDSSYDSAETLGVLYVTEGAALGARLLVLRARALGMSETFGARTLSHQAGDLAPWRRFSTALESFQTTAEQEYRLVRASRQTFELAALHFGARS
jgi:heme oxygenase